MGYGVVERHLEMAQPTKKKYHEIKVLAKQDCLVEANCFGLIGVIDSPSGPKSSSTGY